MAEDPRGSWLSRGTRFTVQVATENWGTKIMALLLALIVFVVTRDEVTRSFNIPLRVIEDPDRVLLTAPPESVELQVRGPWANVNRLSAAELGAASLDLRVAEPGPMELDPAAIVMPRGVVLDTLDYDPVDLRFEALVERRMVIEAQITGQVDGDHRLVSARVEPGIWAVRGRASALDELGVLRTEAVDLADVDGSVDLQVGLEPLPEFVEFVGVDPSDSRDPSAGPRVRFVAEVAALPGELELEVDTAEALRAALPEFEGQLPASERVLIRGPRPLLRQIEGLEAPLRAEISVDDGPPSGASVPVTVRFEWSPELPVEATDLLSITPTLVRLRLATGALTPSPGPAPEPAPE